MTNKFNVGDKVRFLENYAHYVPGDIVEVTGFWSDGINFKNSDGKTGGALYERFELVGPSVTERIATLESEVAELKLIVAQIRKPSTVVEEALANDIIDFEGKQYKKVDREAREGDVVILTNDLIDKLYITKGKLYKVHKISGLSQLYITDDTDDGVLVYGGITGGTPETVDVYELIVEDKQDIEPPAPKTQNELRAEIIEKAKRILNGNFVSKHEFVVNYEKRTIVALLFDHYDEKKVVARGIAKCHVDDVWNDDIGKIIALYRGLGMNASEFEQTVQPNEIVIGMKVQCLNSKGVLNKDEGEICTVAPPGNYNDKGELAAIDSPFVKDSKIINDTNAIYGGTE